MGDQIRTTQHAPRRSFLGGQPSVELHIEELALDGFPDVDRVQLGAVVREELTRLIAERGVPASLAHGGEVAHLDGGAFHVAPGANAQVIGAQIAQAVYGGLRR